MASLNHKKILFIDIETISLVASYDELPERYQTQWLKKAAKLRNEEEETLEDLYHKKAAIYSEFGKVLCIGVGGFYDVNETEMFKAKTLVADSESDLLQAFKKVVEEHPAKNNLILCAHNGKEFDFPFICRRMLINGIKLPAILDISNKKPWEIPHLDTLEMWKFGDYKNYASLELLATVFDIPTSKTNIDGSEVNDTFYLKNDLETITKYCQEDVIVLAQLFLKMNGLETIDTNNIVRS